MRAHKVSNPQLVNNYQHLSSTSSMKAYRQISTSTIYIHLHHQLRLIELYKPSLSSLAKTSTWQTQQLLTPEAELTRVTSKLHGETKHCILASRAAGATTALDMARGLQSSSNVVILTWITTGVTTIIKHYHCGCNSHGL